MFKRLGLFFAVLSCGVYFAQALSDDAVFLIDLRYLQGPYLVTKCVNGECHEGYVISPGKDSSKPYWSPDFSESAASEEELKAFSAFYRDHSLQGVYMALLFDYEKTINNSIWHHGLSIILTLMLLE